MPKSIHAVLAERIRAERKRVGLSIERLAEAAGIGASFLAYIETGGRAPSLTTVAKIAEALDVPACELFRGLKAKPRSSDEIYLRQFSTLIRGKTPAQKAALIQALRAVAQSLR